MTVVRLLVDVLTTGPVNTARYANDANRMHMHVCNYAWLFGVAAANSFTADYAKSEISLG